MVVEGNAQELKPGRIIPFFRLPSANRSQDIGPWDYNQHKNLVLFFFHSPQCAPCRQLLLDLARGYPEYAPLNTEVLSISQTGIVELGQLQRELGLPFPLLSDMDGKVFRAYLGHAAGEPHETAIFVADRWGELYTGATAADADALPGESEIRDWLSFIEIQCPECHPPEWPLL
ncbi:MAG TPA: redoxin domain-containing protein [Blastocatellia bacterium]|jgi:peroxiredoxin